MYGATFVAHDWKYGAWDIDGLTVWTFEYCCVVTQNTFSAYLNI